MHPVLKYIQGYPAHILEPVQRMVESGKLVSWFEQRYPQRHDIQSEKALFNYTMDIKNQYMKKTAPLSKVVYDGKIHLINNALGLHTYVSRVHGNKIKAKNEIRIASAFKKRTRTLAAYAGGARTGASTRKRTQQSLLSAVLSYGAGLSSARTGCTVIYDGA